MEPGTIPTLLGNDGTTAGNYTNDHPVGQLATLSSVVRAARPGLDSAGTSGTIALPPAARIAQFVANYGWPALAPGKWSNPYGVTAAGAPYVLCTTCHNQHVMTVYTSSAASPIAGDGGGKCYATYFFINGPYNPNINNLRQHECSFDDAVLPSVPLWRVERSQQHQQHQTAIPVEEWLKHGGERTLSPFFLASEEL